MQPARIKLHAKEHASSPVQRPNFRGHALTTAEETKVGRSFSFSGDLLLLCIQ